MKTKIKKISNIAGWVVTVLMGLVVVALLFAKLSGEYKIYLVRSGSMTPAINTGDLVISGPVNGPINGGLWPGKIITYVSGPIVPDKPLTLTTHRLVSVDGETLTVKGDSNKIDDQPILRGQVMGVYLFRVPYVGYINSFMHTKKGWLVTVILPALVLITMLAWEIVKEALKSETAKAMTAGTGGKRS